MCTGGQRLAGGLRRGLCGQRPVGSPAVALDGAAGLDLGAGGLGQGLGAGVVDQAQVRAAAAALRRLLGRRREQRLVELDHAAQQQLVLAAAHGLRDLAAQQPDRRQPLAQVGARLVEQRARGQRRLVAAALARPAAAQLPRHRVSAARAAEPFPPALLEKRPPASVLRRIHRHETQQRQRMTHDHSSLETACTREDREPTGHTGMVS
jgi:hypothetical protein